MIGQACKNNFFVLKDKLKDAMKTQIKINGRPTYLNKKRNDEGSLSFLIPFSEEIESKQSNIGENTAENVRENVTTSRKRSISSSKMHFDSETLKTEITDTNSPKLIKNLMKSDKQESKATSNDPLDVFFNGLAATVKSFSPEYQLKAKSKLLEVLSQIELAYLKHDDTVSQVPSTSNSAKTSTPNMSFTNNASENQSSRQDSYDSNKTSSSFAAQSPYSEEFSD